MKPSVYTRTGWRVMPVLYLACITIGNISDSAIAQTQELSLRDAIRIGIENNRSLEMSSLRVSAAAAKASEAKTNVLPSLRLSAGYQRLSDVDPFQISVPFAPHPITIAPTVLNNYTARLALQQPIFTGFRLMNSVRAADYLAEASEFENQSDRVDLAMNITIGYWALYQTLQVSKYVDENVLRIQATENDTKNLLKAGLATRNDLLRVQVQLNNARLAQIDAAGDVEVAMMGLNNILGQPLETPLQLISHPAVPKIEEMRQELGGGAQTNGLGSRPDLMAAGSRVEASKANLSAVQGGWWPQIYIAGGLSYARPNQRYQPIRDEFKGTWDVGVQLSFDILNWGATAYQADQARANLHQAELQFEQMKDNITLEVRRQTLAVQRSREKVRVAKLAIEQANESQRIMNDKYKQGLATSTDIVDANLTVLQANTNYTGALVESAIAAAKLKRATGAE